MVKTFHKSVHIRVHPDFVYVLQRMREDLENLEGQVLTDPQLTKKIADRITGRRRDFARQHKKLFR